jgi:hypothetical protein
MGKGLDSDVQTMWRFAEVKRGLLLEYEAKTTLS